MGGSRAGAGATADAVGASETGPKVFAYFGTETGGKGHLTRMQAVLKAHVEAMKAG